MYRRRLFRTYAHLSEPAGVDVGVRQPPVLSGLLGGEPVWRRKPPCADDEKYRAQVIEARLGIPLLSQ